MKNQGLVFLTSKLPLKNFLSAFCIALCAEVSFYLVLGFIIERWFKLGFQLNQFLTFF